MARKRRSPAIQNRPLEPVEAVTRSSEPTWIQVIYSPPGGVKSHHVRNAPSGQHYHVLYQEPFEIKTEDVSWFFTRWAERQWLRRYGP